MKKEIFIAVFASTSFAKDVYVDGYYRGDGTPNYLDNDGISAQYDSNQYGR